MSSVVNPFPRTNPSAAFVHAPSFCAIARDGPLKISTRSSCSSSNPFTRTANLLGVAKASTDSNAKFSCLKKSSTRVANCSELVRTYCAGNSSKPISNNNDFVIIVLLMLLIYPISLLIMGNLKLLFQLRMF